MLASNLVIKWTAMDINSNSEASFNLDSDVDVISSTSALNMQPIKVRQSSGSMQSREKDAVDLQADEQEWKYGLFKHFTAISQDEHLQDICFRQERFNRD
jgi:hypothetical protein